MSGQHGQRERRGTFRLDVLAAAMSMMLLSSGCASLDADATIGGGGGIGARGGDLVVGLGTRENPLRARRPDEFGGDSDGAARSGLMRKPLAAGRLTSRFGAPRGSRRHAGIDYAAPPGTPVYAAGAGTVDKLYTSASYGNYVRIRHAGGLQTAYAHLRHVAPGLSVGSRVARGQTIGGVGSTGRASGPHLHYEVIRDGKSIDPLGADVARAERADG